MKQRIKSNKFIILAMCAVLSLFMGFACLISANFTRADEATADANTFEMLSGAEVRTEEPYGLRFKVRVGSAVKEAIESVKNTETETDKGFLIFPKQYLASVTCENPDYKDKENGGLNDYIDIPIGDGTWYYEVDDDKNQTGYYLYNGVIYNIKDTNRSLEYAAIAYYKNSYGSYVYADFDKDFGRSITYVLSKGYLNSADVRTTVSTYFGWFGTQNYPVSIESEEDMFAFANAINGGETFENKYFKLNNDLSLDGWTAIRSGFSGTLDCNGKTVTLLSGGDKFIECGTVTKTDDTVVGDKQYAFKATAGSARNFVTSLTSGEFVENSSIPNKADDYTGNAALRGNCASGAIFAVTLNYTREELTALKSDYNTVTVSFMFTGTATDSSKTATVNDNYGTTSSITHAGIVYKTGLKQATLNNWYTYTISLDDLIETMGLESADLADNQALLTRIWYNGTNVNGTVNAYVGDIVLSYVKPTILIVSEANKNNVEASATRTFVDNTTLKSTFTSGDIESYSGGAITLSRTGGQDINVTIDLSADELTALKSKYSSVVFNIGVVYEGNTTGVWINTANNRANYLLNKVNQTTLTSGTWYTKTISIDDFIAALNTTTPNKVTFMTTGVSPSSGDNITFALYIGDIEFVEAE